MHRNPSDRIYLFPWRLERVMSGTIDLCICIMTAGLTPLVFRSRPGEYNISIRDTHSNQAYCHRSSQSIMVFLVLTISKPSNIYQLVWFKGIGLWESETEIRFLINLIKSETTGENFVFFFIYISNLIQKKKYK